MPDIERFVLLGRGLSGRAIRLRRLLPSELDRVTKDAAIRTPGQGPTQAFEFRIEQIRIGVARCLKGITKGAVPLLDLPVLEGGKPKMRPAKDDEGRPKVEDGKPVMEPVLAPQPDPTWLADEKNWITPGPIDVEMAYDSIIGSAKDDAWLGAWWRDAHEVSNDVIERILEKGQRVSSG